MKIALIDARSKIRLLGETSTNPVPRIGENIVTGYVPYPKVTGVIHDYSQDTIFVTIDGFFYTENKNGDNNL